MSSITRSRVLTSAATALILLGSVLSACSEAPAAAEGEHAEHDDHGGHDEAEEHETEKGPNGGRMLRDGNFALELTIFEEGVEPQFRLFAYADNQLLAPGDVTATVTLARLGGETNVFAFTPEGSYLKGDGAVTEPHSFDVTLNASHAGQQHTWTYDSYEGRTTIAAASAAEAGVRTAQAGPATIRQTIDLSGRVTLAPSGRAEVKAWFPGRIVSLKANIGDRVKRGDAVATVEASDSLKTYSIPAPIDGVVIERMLNVGDVAGDGPIVVIGNPQAVLAELHVFPLDAEKVRPGQAVELRSLSSELRTTSVIEAFLPVTEAATQTLTARAVLTNPDEAWRPGMAVEGHVTVSETPVPLAVRASGIQRFRDFTVVFAQVGETYEVRMLELGRKDAEWVEVLSGLKPGETYVTENAFLIRADIEKSGASHDH